MKNWFRNILVAACLLLWSAPMAAEYGDWKVYASYHNAEKAVGMGGRIYVLSYGGLFSYDPEDTSVESYDKATLLSDHGIYDMALCQSTSELVLVYTNGNIDILTADGDCYNMPELKNKTMDDKTINEFSIVGDKGYISTNSGVVELNISKRVFANFYDLGVKVNSCTELNGTLYAATMDGVYMGNTSSNLLDRNNWRKQRPYVLQHIIHLDNNLFALASDALYQVPDIKAFTIAKILSGRNFTYSVTADRLYLFNTSGTVSVNATGTIITLTGGEGMKSLYAKGNDFWAACGTEGLKGVKLNNNTFEQTVAPISLNSPWRNYSYRLLMADDRLLVGGGAFNYSGPAFKEGTIMRYENGEWTSFDEAGPQEQSGGNYFNVTDIVQDPSDPQHHFAGTAASGVYEFQDYKLKNYFTYTNSPITSILPTSSNPNRYTRVTSLALDRQRNLWMCNTQCDTIIRIRKNDGTWKALYFEEIAGYPTFDYTVFDNRGWAWINSRRSVESFKAGIFVLNNNGTVDNTADDTHKFISQIINQDGTSYTPDLVNCITPDLDGAIWFGTSLGLFVSYNPGDVFKSNFHFSQVKVPRNDGTNLADYLLNGVNVKCVTIDGGNRKWIGTLGNGVYLVSNDGQETIEHFTTDNSPLISNDIYSIAIDGRTGEVFIATDAGLVSFMGNATDPEEEFDSDRVKVYPNPVRPEYQGLISITGLMYNSNVKIVNAAGRLVHEGTSVGGEYTWNGLTSSGKKASSGIYYILATDETGEDGVASKFLIVK